MAVPAGASAAFIRANTRLMAPPLVPEVLLHLAEESLPIWTRTEEELDEIGLPPPFWAFAWAGGQALARYILDEAQAVAGKHVLDLASGSGLTAIAAMLAGARSCLACEVDAFAVAAIALNAEANGVAIEARLLDVLDGQAPPADVVLVGDMFYEQELARRLLAFLERCRAAGRQVLVGDPGRSYFPRARFGRLAEYSVPVTRELEDSLIKRAAVWCLA